jgi:hypothetical protein
MAFVVDFDDRVYPDVEVATKDLGADEAVRITVVRGTAVPIDDGEDRPCMPGTFHAGDVAYEVDAYLTDPDDPSVSATVRFEQACAMVDGLNRAARGGDQ